MKGLDERKAWLTARGFFDKYISANNFTLTYAQTMLTPGTPLVINGTRYMNKTDNKKTRLTTMVYKGEIKAHSNHRDKPLPLEELNDDTDDKLTLLL